mmetsp:Transcript_3442/g.9895  ORF Transcript_3442/g.9895 Transcript_3442/m.9895 type:complete len:233 (-) Transcript_3442:518-1216(-)
MASPRNANAPHVQKCGCIRHGSPLHELHGQHPLAGAPQIHLRNDHLLPNHGTGGCHVGPAALRIAGLVLEVQFLWQILLNLVYQPLVVKVREEPLDGAHEPLDGHRVYRRHHSQPRVLDLHCQLPAVVVMGHVDLCQRGAGNGDGVEASIQLLWVSSEVLPHRGAHLLPAADRASVQQVAAHCLHVLLREQVVQLSDVLPELDVYPAILEAQVHEAVGAPLVALVELLLVFL